MGKSKKKKLRTCSGSNNPVGLPSVKDAEEMETREQPAVTGVVASLLEKLQSPSTEERECACLTVASISTNQQAVKKLLLAGIVKVVGPLLIDTTPNVRLAAIGALRNMTVEGGPEGCEEMVRQDIMTPVVALFQKYGANFSFDNEDKAAAETSRDIYLQVLHLLWNLCESSEMAVKIFNQQKLLLVLLPCLQVDKYGYDIATAAAQCLYAVTEDNTEAVSFLNQDEFLVTLSSTVKQQHMSQPQMMIRLLAAGILYNITRGTLVTSGGSFMNDVIIFLSEVLSVDVTPHVARTTDIMTKSNGFGNEENSANIEANSEFKKSGQLHLALEETKELLSCQKLALEMVANISCGQDEDEEWEDLDSSDSSEDAGAGESVAMEAEQGVAMEPLSLSSEVESGFSQTGIAEKVLNKVTLPDPSLLEILSSHRGGKPLLKSLTGVQSHALLCINNLVTTVSLETLGGCQGLHTLWDRLASMAGSASGQEQPELLEATTSAMRAVIQKLAELQSPKFQEVTAPDLQFLVQMGLQHALPQVRANAVRIAATIGCMLAKSQPKNQAIKDLGLFLLEVCCKESAVWVIAETLDSIFDLFGENSLEPVCKEIELVGKLKALAPGLKVKVQQQKRHLGEHLPIIQTARTNLSRFIKYKSSL